MDRDTLRRGASRILIVLGLYQAAVPLVVRGAFGGDQRFAPALWLPSPWWWIACLAIVAVTAALVVALEAGTTGGSREAVDDTPERGDREGTAAAYDGLSAVVFLLGLYNGIAPFVARLLFDGDLLLAITLRLPSPWWWIASLGVLAAAVALLSVIDAAKQRRLGDE